MAIQWIKRFCPVVLAIVSLLFIPNYANALETKSMTLSPTAVSMTETLLTDPSPKKMAAICPIYQERLVA